MKFLIVFQGIEKIDLHSFPRYQAQNSPHGDIKKAVINNILTSLICSSFMKQ